MRAFDIIFFILFCGFVNGEVRHSLNSDKTKWIVFNGNNSIRTEAKVPGGIYTDLQNAGQISQNLFYRFNDIEYRWIGRDSWTYQTRFNLTSDIMNKTAVRLVLHGVDTIATIFFNDHLVASTENMFVRHVIPIREHVKEFNNTLEIRFKSPIEESRNLSENHNYTVPPKCTPAHYNGECHVNFVRKMQASFAWDWGPAFPSVGLWKDVEIEAFDAAVLRDVTAKLDDFNATTWRLNATAYLEAADGDIGGYEILAQISTEKDIIRPVSCENIHKNGEIISRLQFMISKDSVNLWWPNGFGEQPLYEMKIIFQSKKYSERSEKELKIGIRKIELIQENIRPLKDGLTFYFKVNGIPIFAKGSNWIPSHILPELSYDEKRLRSLLLSAKDAHMNMLRVWGGGLYESDIFYTISDELGIMIWQDMMYACSMYPTDQKFLESVSLETEQQVRRLQHHSSIALFAGNNENEAALRGNWYGTSNNFELYKSDYVKLYVNTIKPIVLENDGTRDFLVSSPTNGIMSEREGYVARDPYSPLYGDTHYYNYILDSWNSNIYPYTRFASEYGFQSLPSIKTMSEVSLPSDRRLDSQFSAKRQHLLAGYVLMTLQMLLRLPQLSKDDSEEHYKNFVYYSQIGQAMGTKTETEKYRRDRNKLTKKNEGRTMGAMYWQLNDVWQAPSWSSIDFSGRWKMVHYYAKKFFSPILISPELTIDHYINLYIISDLTEDVNQAEMNVSVYSWDSFEPIKVISSTETVRRGRSFIHARYELSDLLTEANCSDTRCFVYTTLTATTPKISIDNALFPKSFAKVENLEPAEIQVSVKNEEVQNLISIELQSDRIAPFVWLETDEVGQFSDNGFLLVEKKKTITFGNRNEKVNFEKFKKSLTVRSLLR